MAVPLFVGSSSLRSITNSTVIDISAIANGSWMVVSVMSSTGSTTTVTAPGAWSTLNSGETTGTRRNFLFAKIKDSGDGSSVTFTQNVTVSVAYGLTWGTGGGDITSWTIGTTWNRLLSSQASGARFDSIARSVTTPSAEELVLAISHEATNAKVAPMEITSISPSGWTQHLWLEQGASDQIETIWVGSKDMSTVGASGDVTLTYSTQQDSNGWTIQIAIPKSVVATPPPSPVVVGTPTTFFNQGPSFTFTIARPSGVVVGDYIIVAVRTQNSDTTVGFASSGFTRLGAAFVNSDGASRSHGLYGRPVTDMSSEPTGYVFTWTAGTNNRAVASAFIVRGVDLTNPVSGYFNSYAGTTVTGPPTGKSVDSYALAAAPALSLFMGSAEFASPNVHTPSSLPSSYTEIINVATATGTAASRTYMWVGYQQVAATPVAAAQILWTTPSGPAAEGISLRGTHTVPSNPVGSGISAANGSGGAVKVYYNTSTGARTPSALVPMRRGFSTTADVLSTYGSTWAHRGGSDSYPEMSLYGYTQSVMRGYGVLEVSLARTSDGVWFGLHDQTTDRTSGGTFGNASSQTWAQIQAQNIVIGNQGAPQPYMTWKQLVSAYGLTHIIVADPKYALGTYRTEFLNMVYNDIGPTRAIIKYSGGGSSATAMSTAAIGMGFETWGFFYASDASAAQGGNGALQTWGNYWTTIGMEYGASQAIWNEALAIGKPIIGHIAPNQAAYNAAMTKGAIGVQVSGVAVVEPISWWNTMPKFANLIAAYGFNEGSGSTVADSSIRGNNLTVGTLTGWATGHKGSGLQSSGTTGTGGYNTSFANTTTAITLMGWAYPRTITGDVPLFGFWSSPNSDPTGTNQFALYASRSAVGTPNTLSVTANINSAQTVVNGAAMTINTWQHVAATFDGTTLKIYLNGALVTSASQSGSLGVGTFATTAHTDSIADDVRVFNTALTQAEIVKWMNRSI